MSILAQYYEDTHEWLGFHTDSPIMVVAGDTEEIVRGIIEKNLVWYVERQLKKREQAVLEALAQVIKFVPEEAPDTTPSEITGYEETNEGC